MWLLSYIHWNASPEIVELGPVVLRWYGLLFALGFYIGFYIVRWMFRRENKDERDLNVLLVVLVASAVIGARLGHCLFYEPAYYLKHPLEILKVWQGGLASHGGTIAILLALGFYCRRRPDQPYLWTLDRIVVPTALAAAFIRTGNLFNSEILGNPSDVPWAFVFMRVDAVPRHPAQLYEAVAYLAAFFILLWTYRRMGARTPHGLLLGMFMMIVFTARFFIEFVKQRQAEYEQGMLISVGQWLSVPFILFGVLLVYRAWRAHAPPR